MITLELTIRPQARTTLPTHAQFVIGDSSQGWIDEIARWNVNDHELRLLVVPRSRRDLKPIGVLVFNRDGSPLQIPNHCLSVKTLAYGLIGSQLFLPCDATTEPAIPQTEIAQHLTPDRTYVWHPTAGLVAANADELLSVSDLFLAPELIPAVWDEAQSGTAWARHLTSVALLPEASPSATDAIEGGKDDIGSNTSDIKSINPIEDPDGQTGEPTNSPLGKAIDASVAGFAKFIQGMTGMVPRGSANYNWINRAEDWAANKLAGMSEKLEQQRFKELFRLQRLLEQDPEKGLQYALPLNSTNLSRGTAAPSSQLNQRQTNFSLSGLRGGQPADYWDIPEDLRINLNKQYRELAEREINLGRYRRAAYIYGELLADLNAAARTLEAGKHYREAAVLYRTKLNRNIDAARCLEKGGLWSELIALREELHQYEMAGDVYIQLGLKDQADAAFVQAVCEHIVQENFIEAARIEEQKRDDIESALVTLKLGWPNSEQANICLQGIFRVLASEGRHNDSRAWLARVEDDFPDAKSQPDVLMTVAELASDYPDQATRELAHETTYRIASSELTDKPYLGWLFLNSINKLHPEDKLLSRDSSKFKSQFGRKTTSLPDHPTQQSHGPLLVTKFSLSNKVEWSEGINLGSGYLLVGQKDQHVTIAKLSADFKTLSKKECRLNSSRKRDFIVAKTLDNQRVIVNCPFDDQFMDQEIFAGDDSSEATIVDSTWIDHGTIGIAQGQNDQWIIVRVTDTNEFLLEIQSAAGVLMSSKPLDFGSSELNIPVPIHFDGSKAHLAMGQKLVSVTAEGNIEIVEFDEPIRSIRGGFRHTISRFVLAFSNGVKVFWDDEGIGDQRLICRGMVEPQTLFTRSGHLIVAADRSCEIYRTSNREVQYVATIEIESCVRLMRTSGSNRFAVLTEAGNICVYRIPM